MSQFKTEKGQKNFLASNTYFLAEVKVDNVSVPLAIYDDSYMAGSTMHWHDGKNERGLSIDL
jgi:hypothetical protein